MVRAIKSLNSYLFSIYEDGVVENPDEEIILTMGDPTGASKGSTDIQAVIIIDND